MHSKACCAGITKNNYEQLEFRHWWKALVCGLAICDLGRLDATYIRLRVCHVAGVRAIARHINTFQLSSFSLCAPQTSYPLQSTLSFEELGDYCRIHINSELSSLLSAFNCFEAMKYVNGYCVLEIVDCWDEKSKDRRGIIMQTPKLMFWIGEKAVASRSRIIYSYLNLLDLMITR